MLQRRVGWLGRAVRPPLWRRAGCGNGRHDPGIVLLFRATRAIDLGAVPGPTPDVSAVPVPGGQQLLLSVAT